MKKVMMVLSIVGIALAALTLAGVQAQGPAPSSLGPVLGSSDTINFQGQLYDKATGGPATPGDYPMRFSICADAGCGTVVWGPREFTAAVDDDGLFNVLLAGLSPDHFTGDRWLRVEVWNGSNWDWMSPNQPITGVALAIGNLRKNVVEESRASSNLSILSVINEANGRGITGESATGIGVYGFSYSSTGIEGYSPNWRGVYGHSDSGTGVYGYASATSGWTYGVYGQADSTDSHAIHGYSAGGVGVYGWGGSGVWGVRGRSPDSYGVAGWSEGSDEDSFGVYGRSNGRYGVVGIASATDLNYPASGSVGVLGSVSHSGDYGVYGANNDMTGGYGVYGRGYNGVYGGSNTSGKWAIGVYGTNLSTGAVEGTGVYGRSQADQGYGVAGHNYWAGVGVGAWSYSGNIIEAYDGDYPGGVLRYYFQRNGWAYADGGWGTFLSGAGGSPLRVFYGMQSPEVWLEDFGTATLSNGRAVVSIESQFAQMVNLQQTYHIFIQVYGNAEVYVTNRTATQFEVRLREGDPNVEFSYRIVAKRLGYETLRMEPAPVPPGRNKSREEILPEMKQMPLPQESDKDTVPPQGTGH